MTTGALLPVNVITGFLGSGKTTLLKAVLESEAFGDSAVLVNEFGDVGLDNRLLGNLSEDVVLLQSGCVCCTIRGELSDAIRRLLSQRENGEVPPFSRIILETTGLADPGPIASTLSADPVLRNQVRPGASVAVVDAVHALGNSETEPVWSDQVAVADKIVISKCDLVDADRLQAVRALVARINPAAGQFRRDALGAPPAELFDAGPHLRPMHPARLHQWLGTGLAHQAGQHHHLHDIHSFRLRFSGSVDWTCLGIWLSMLLNRHGPSILRIKGVLRVQGDARPVLVHGVQHTIHPPVHLEDWPEEDRRSELVFITRGVSGARVIASVRRFMEELSSFPAPGIEYA